MPVPLEQYAAELRRTAFPSDVVELLTYLFGEVLDGRNADLTDGVRGRSAASRATSPTTQAGAAGAWNPVGGASR